MKNYLLWYVGSLVAVSMVISSLRSREEERCKKVEEELRAATVNAFKNDLEQQAQKAFEPFYR